MTGDDPALKVTGGAGGVTAEVDDLATLARLSDGLAETLGRVSAECHEMLADPDVLASAVLDPGGAARFAERLLSALDGPHGLTALALGFTEEAVLLRASAAGYHGADATAAAGMDKLRWSAGFLAPLIALPIAGPLLLTGLGAAGTLAAMSPSARERLLTDHPGIIDGVEGALPGLLTALTPLHVPSVVAAAGLIGAAYPDGELSFSGFSVDSAYDATHPAPDGFGDLMDGLRNRDDSDQAGQGDKIDVRVLSHPDGTHSYIVDIPGTKTWDGPGLNTALNDFGTNVHGIAGDPTTREQAVADALRRAGAGPRDPVMLIGHSQGGLIAAQAAHDSGTGSFNYNVTHVLTAGAPIGRVEIPPTVQVLALENSHDIVPHLDARANADLPNVTTVTFDRQNGSIGDNHGLVDAYAPAAVALDHSDNPSVRAYLNSAGAFVAALGDGATIQTNVYTYCRA